MSVLLDALKKAAMEKREAKTIVDSKLHAVETTFETPEIIQQDIDGLSLDVNIEQAHQIDADDVPLFQLKPSETLEKMPAESLLDTELQTSNEINKLSLKLMDVSEKLNEPNLMSNNTDIVNETTDLPSDTNTKVEALEYTKADIASEKIEGDSLNDNTIQLDNSSSEPIKSDQTEETTHNDGDFSWSLNDLPGYTQNNQKGLQDNNTKPVNSVLLGHDNVPPKKPTKYTTSIRVVTSLLVILLFLGIGFYGMLYYQEQSDELENSMKKYNLSKISLATNQVTTNQPISAQKITSDSGNFPEKNLSHALNEHDLTKPLEEQNNSASKQNLMVDNDERIQSIETDKLDSDLINAKVNQAPEIKQKQPQNPVISNQATIRNSSNNTDKRMVQNNHSLKGVIVTNSVKSDIAKAYTAYEKGNFSVAKDLFSKILQKDPKNINAMLGMGGISVALNDYYQAVNYYQRVLNLEPGNIYAFEAMSGLFEHVEFNEKWKDELKNMSKAHPNSAILQYVQGNVYAKQGDWLKAQQSYFKALVAEPSNADYMVNVAICFDHLGKYRLADKYYAEALAYSERNKVNFDKIQVKNRLISIRQFIVKGN